MAQSENSILVRKYFPQDWNDLILPTTVMETLKNVSKTKGYRLLLFSKPGSGKTSTSRIISKNDEVMYLSGSNDFKIDTLRNKVMGFASGMSINNKQKTIIIDEFENIRDDLQDAFKIILDKAVKVNFIFITNEVEKVNSAIKSRCTNLDYDFFGSDLEELRKKYVNFALKVGKTENIKYDADGMRELYKINFPDFRHLLVHMQQLIDSNKDITLENVKMFSESGKQIVELYSLIENPAITGQEFYLEMVKFKTKEKECLTSLGEPFFQYLNNKNLHSKTLEAAIVVSKYSDVYTRSINKFVTLLSCVIELKSLFR